MKVYVLLMKVFVEDFIPVDNILVGLYSDFQEAENERARLQKKRDMDDYSNCSYRVEEQEIK